ncbi:glycoside hydrolase family 19 protein [Paraburkholderia graminis]|uniref:glycoside hydrolase family 19 protein n=1 Tax=Paraburkholderia graminis TaxID=60548 RepID=UPI0038BDBCD1
MQLNASIVAAGCGSTVLRASQWVQPIQSACDRYEINTPLRIAAFLATVGVESGRLVWVREIWGPTPAQSLYEPQSKKAAQLGNTEPGDGRKFCGRGCIQVTGRSNYAACGKALGLDLISHPELLEQPANAALSAAWFWSTHKINGLADGGDFLAVSRAVNLGSATSRAMPNGYSERLALYGAAKKSLGV